MLTSEKEEKCYSHIEMNQKKFGKRRNKLKNIDEIGLSDTAVKGGMICSDPSIIDKLSIK